jgi:iron complex transport system ATP-binding protein
MVGALSAYRLVELGRYPHVNWYGGLSSRDREIVERSLQAVGAAHLASRDSNSLSDGERQRIMIARALAQEPSILLLDEPTAFLDVPSRVQVMGLLRHLAREQHLAIVVSTHDLELALRMADSLWLIAAGGKFHTGTPEDIILDGSLAEAFQAENIRFQPEERAFRLATVTKGRALIKGGGLPAVLAAAVLEREGYEIVTEGPFAICVTTLPGSAGWEVVIEGTSHAGTTFAELAALVRKPDTRKI